MAKSWNRSAPPRAAAPVVLSDEPGCSYTSGHCEHTGYYYVYRLVESWRQRIAAIGVVACLSGISQGLGLQLGFDAAHLTILVGAALANVIIGCAFAWFNWITHRQSLLRRQHIRELNETNNGLEASLAENSGLHRWLLAQAREAGDGQRNGRNPTAGQKGQRPSGRSPLALFPGST